MDPVSDKNGRSTHRSSRVSGTLIQLLRRLRHIPIDQKAFDRTVREDEDYNVAVADVRKMEFV